MEVVDNVLQDKIKNGIAIVRPPGHHSGVDYSMGFCLFNNIAVAAQYAKKNYGLKRILIFEW